MRWSAVRAGDMAQLKEIFGPEGEDIISSGDPIADRAERERFLAAYDVRQSLQSDLSGGLTLVVGEQDWPFPVPIIISNDGYSFDTPVGREEILNRRIGTTNFQPFRSASPLWMPSRITFR